jgi:nucleoside-diphosphate-sugar epimerase
MRSEVMAQDPTPSKHHDGSSKTAFVTGATGFVGLNLVSELCALGWDVIALHRPSSDLSYLKRFPVRLAMGAVENLVSIENAMPENVDVVFHLAADLSFWTRNNLRQTRTNVVGTRNVVEAALRRGARRFVHTSSTIVYGFPIPPFDETASLNGLGSWFNYMHTKALAEEELRRGIDRGLDAVILSPAHVIGRYGSDNWARLIQLAAGRGLLVVVPSGRGSFGHATAVARAHIAAATCGRTGENYILGGCDATYVEVVRIAGELMGRRPKVLKVRAPAMHIASFALGLASRWTKRPPSLTREGAHLLSRDVRVRSDKAIAELGYEPADLRTMVEDCYRWLVEEGKLPNLCSASAEAAGSHARAS